MATGLVAVAAVALAQSSVMNQGGHRMEIALERQAVDGSWRAVDPGLVLDQGDHIRFRFTANFNGFLYVGNQGTSGNYEQLFPREETGRNNRISAGKDYRIPATATAFRIAGPAGHETVYWLVSPVSLGAPPSLGPGAPPKAPKLIPRCDDVVLHARGDCVDSSAGLHLIPREAAQDMHLADEAARGQRDLLVMRQEDTAVVSSAAPLTGPVVYEFLLAHR